MHHNYQCIISILFIFLIYNTAISSNIDDNRSIWKMDTTDVEVSAEAKIEFSLSHSAIDQDYRDNHRQLAKVLTTIDAVSQEPNLKMSNITVIGAASPDGKFSINERLSHARAQALANILKNRYNFPTNIYTISSISEDWNGLTQAVRQDENMPYRTEILQTLNNSTNMHPDAREEALKTIADGMAYKMLLTDVMPQLRHTTIQLKYTSESVTRHRIGERIKQLPPITMSLPTLRPQNDLHPIQSNYIQHDYANQAPRQRFWSIKTNALWDMALCPNIGIEVELWPQLSLDLPVWYSPYDITDTWRIRLLATQPEVRYWTKKAGQGHFFGLHCSVIGFNVSFNGDYRWQDPNHAAFGLGVGYGFATHLDKARKWGLEFNVGAGYINYKWVKYANISNGKQLDQGHGTYWGITRAGISFSYKFYIDRRERRWMKW